MNIAEKVAYLRGLLQGLSFDEDSKEAKVFDAIIDTLDEIAMAITDLEENQGELEELVSIIDEDLGDLEDDFYEDDDDEADDDDFDEEYYEVVCPTCGDTICLDESMLDEGEMVCPNCGEHLEFDLDDIEDCCCGEEHCDCGCEDK
ncbi:MAG: CD1247 N-terminal domain-containing protein [Oscillospiraceae bacterium]|jgi:DNA-directed RNA polymerase subunit RPC12/RpoP